MEFGTPQEIGAKPGDVLMCMKHDYTLHDVFIPGEHYTVDNDGQIKSEYKAKMLGDFAVWCVVSRASDDTPKMWCDITDEEKGALLLAQYEGKEIQYWHRVWREWRLPAGGGPSWFDVNAYRVKPEPVRETFTHEQWVSMHEGSTLGSFSILYGQAYDNDVKGRTTIETADGKPVKIVWEPVK